MFERNKIDNTLQWMTVAAEITLTSGESVNGRFVVSASRSLVDTLNGTAQFLDFETYDGQRALLAKSTLAAVRLANVPSAGALKSRMREADVFDPHEVLGVPGSAAWDDIRQAYLTLSKTYHPDRYLGADLPDEVRIYLDAMARRINVAYAALEAPRQTAKRAEIEKAKPIFTSRQPAAQRTVP